MKLCLVIFSFMFMSVFVFSDNIYSQNRHTFAVYYNYLTKKNEHYRTYYPLGFGSFISGNISDKLVLTGGLECSSYQNDSSIKFTPSVYRTEYTYFESHYSFIAGLAYTFLERKLCINGGGDILSTYFRTRGEVSRYINSTGDMDFHTSSIDNDWDLGVKLKVDFIYYLSENLGIMVQPGFIHYFLTEATKSDYFSASAGLALKF